METPKTWRLPTVPAPSAGGAVRSAAPTGLSPAVGGLQPSADYKLLRAPFGHVARLRPQPDQLWRRPPTSSHGVK
eukprot:8542521-Alexandrium_andersonii.AAC.1